MLVGVAAALSAWDLDHFTWRLRAADHVEKAAALERVHLRRLLAVDAVGLALGAIALGIHIRLGFGLALVLVLVAVWGLSRAVRLLRQGGERITVGTGIGEERGARVMRVNLRETLTGCACAPSQAVA